jgi:hypothetical protein
VLVLATPLPHHVSWEPYGGEPLLSPARMVSLPVYRRELRIASFVLLDVQSFAVVLFMYMLHDALCFFFELVQT